jgi:hypothetical protein
MYLAKSNFCGKKTEKATGIDKAFGGYVQQN